MKKVKLATKISIMVISVVFIGLVSLWIITNISITSMMEKSTIARMTDTTETQSEIVEGFIDKAESFLHGFIFSDEIRNGLQNPDNTTAIENMQKYNNEYASANSGLENLYVANYDSTVLTGVVTATIGRTLREGESLAGLRKNVFASKDVYNTGIMASPGSGKQVVSMYCPIYDEYDKPIGFAGAAIYAAELMDTLKELNSRSDNSNSILLLDMNKKVYIFNDDENKLAAEIEEPELVTLINKLAAGTAQELDVYSYTDNTGKKMTSVYKHIKDRQWVFMVVDEDAVVYHEVNIIKNTLFILCGIILFVIAGVVWITIYYMTKGLRDVGGIIDRIGQLNLTQEEALRMFSSRGDEVGIIASATDKLIDAIKDVVINLQTKSDELRVTSTDLKEAASLSFETVTNVDIAIQEISQGVANQAKKTQQAAQSVVNIGKMIEDTTNKSEKLSKNSYLMQRSSSNAVETLKRLNTVNDKARKAINVIYEQTNNTNESTVKIKNAASLITAIAEETNLLSLNASIEAARAGEQGKGFAVVATEIQKLAEQSNASAHQIDEIIDLLLVDSSKAVATMNEVKEIMSEQSSFVNETEKIFNEIRNGVTDSIDGINGINERVNEMDKERITVVDAVSSLAAIAEENAAGTERTSASTTKVNVSMESIKDSVEKLNQISAVIDDHIGVFKI